MSTSLIPHPTGSVDVVPGIVSPVPRAGDRVYSKNAGSQFHLNAGWVRHVDQYYPDSRSYSYYYEFVPGDVGMLWDPSASGGDGSTGGWVHDGSWPESKERDPIDHTTVHQDDTPVSKPEKNSSVIGHILEHVGYNFLGPTPNLADKLARGVKPVDALDAAALKHDKNYADIVKRFENGDYSYEDAMWQVGEADALFKREAEAAGDTMGLLASYGLSLAEVIRFAVDFTGIDPARYAIYRPGGPPAVHDPEFTHSSIPNVPGRGDISGTPHVRGIIDLNRNHVPDNLEDRVNRRVFRYKTKKRKFGYPKKRPFSYRWRT